MEILKVRGMIRRVLIIGIMMLVALCSVSVTEAKTIYVPDDHVRIQWAVDNATTGDMIIVRDGIYIENVDVKKNLTIMSENGPESTIVEAANESAPVFEVTGDYVTIKGFTVRWAVWGIIGIYLTGSNHCITSNKIIGGVTGISFTGSNHCIISNNNVTRNQHGIYSDNSNGNTLTNNDVYENQWQGIYLYKSNNNRIINNNVELNGADGIYLNKSRDNMITNNNVNQGFFHGIHLYESSNIVINNNVNSNEEIGIYIEDSSNNVITSNNASNNYIGIFLRDSSKNVINHTNVSNNFGGITLLDSSNNRIVDNIFVNDGLIVSDSYQNIVKNNIVNRKPLIYLENKTDRLITEAGQIILVNCDNITMRNLDLFHATVGLELWRTSNSKIANNNISNNYCGIELWFSKKNIIANNNISNNLDGIHLWDSSGNTVNNNLISYNHNDGLYLDGSSNNIIYLNNFINNSDNVHSSDSTNIWYSTSEINYTYKSKTCTNYLGNYWDDHAGKDADEDGIGDAPFIIDDNKDNYPLMKQREIYVTKGGKEGIAGFEAIFAIVGLLAIAYLLRRK